MAAGPAYDHVRAPRHRARSIQAAALATILGASIAGVAQAAVVPNTTITAGPAGPVASRTATFSFSSTVAGSTFQCKIDAGAWVACATPKTYNKLTQGAHTFRVRAKKGTRIDKTPALRAFTVDTVAPNTSITSGPIGTTLDIRPEFTFSSSQTGSTFQCSIDLAAFASCASPFNANAMTLHAAHTLRVRARDGAGNLDATPATRTFTIEPVNLGGQPFADAAADLYFPPSVDLDAPAQCAGTIIDCPGGTPLPPAAQVRMQTTNLSVVYAPGTNRFDVTATISVQTLQNTSIGLLLAGSNCTLTLDSSLGTLASWTGAVQMQFGYDPTNGDLRITRSNSAVTGVQSQDWQLSGDLLCVLGGLFNSAGVQGVFLQTLDAYWDSMGVALCERPAPDLVGPCPE